MAIPQHLEVLKQGVAAWNKWRNDNPGEEPDLAGAKLSKTDMPGEPYWPPQIYYFWSIHLRIHPKPSFVFDISDQIDQKMQAIRCYESQMLMGRSTEHPTILDDIKDRARYWGWTIHRGYGEPFASREEVGLESFLPLLSTKTP